MATPKKGTEVEAADPNAFMREAKGMDFVPKSWEEIEAAFSAMVDWRAEAVFVGPDPVFSTQRTQLVTLSARHALPASYYVRDFVEVGGLMRWRRWVGRN